MERKRILSVLLTVCILVSVIPTIASAKLLFNWTKGTSTAYKLVVDKDITDYTAKKIADDKFEAAMRDGKTLNEVFVVYADLGGQGDSTFSCLTRQGNDWTNCTNSLQELKSKEYYVIGTVVEPKPSLFDLRYGKGTVTEMPKDPAYRDYIFGGWYTGIDGTGEKLTGEPEQGATYYAKWIKNKKTVLTQGISVKEDGVYIAGSKVAATEQELAGYGLAYDVTKSPVELTMDNLEIDMLMNKDMFYAIDVCVSSLEIKLIGENTIISGGTIYYKSGGFINANGYELKFAADTSASLTTSFEGKSNSGLFGIIAKKLTVGENVTLNISTKHDKPTSVKGNYALNIIGGDLVNYGIINANSGSSTDKMNDSIAIFVVDGNLINNKKAKITAAGDYGYNGYGISFRNQMGKERKIVNEGTIIAKKGYTNSEGMGASLSVMANIQSRDCINKFVNRGNVRLYGTANMYNCALQFEKGIIISDDTMTVTKILEADGVSECTPLIAGGTMKKYSYYTYISKRKDADVLIMSVTGLFDLRNGEKFLSESPENPAFEDYTFDGWYTGIDGTGEKLTGEPKKETIYYAKWIKNGKTVLTQPIEVKDDGVYVDGKLQNDLSDFGITFTPAEGEKKAKLTLDNAAITNTGIADNKCAAVLISVSDIEINLIGKNSIENINSDAQSCSLIGILGEKMSFTGAGELNIASGKKNQNNQTFGILANDNLSIDKNVNVIVYAEDKMKSAAVRLSGNLILSGTLTVELNSVSVKGDIIMGEDGEIILKGKKDDMVKSDSIKHQDKEEANLNVIGGTKSEDGAYVKSNDTNIMTLTFKVPKKVSSGGGAKAGGKVTVSKKTEHGKVSVTPAYLSKGGKATITAKPDDGYVVSKVTVKDTNGKEVEVTSLGNNLYTFIGEGTNVTVDVIFSLKEEVAKRKALILTIGKKAASLFGEIVENDVAPVIKKDRTMLPIRFVAEALNAKVDWNSKKGKITITREDNFKIVIYINSDTAYLNDKEVKLDSPAFIENDRTYTPIRFVAEELGAKVEWVKETQEVVITK